MRIRQGWHERPALESVLTYLRPEDSLVVCKLYCLGRYLVEMMRIIDELRQDGLKFQSLTERFGSETVPGRFALQMHGAMAANFLDLNRERTMEELKAALARGRKGGWPAKPSDEDVEAARAMLTAGTIPVADIAKRRGAVGQPSTIISRRHGAGRPRPGGQLMPIRPQRRWLFPVEWQHLTDMVRFERAKRRCEQCQLPHGKIHCHRGGGSWWDEDACSRR